MSSKEITIDEKFRNVELFSSELKRCGVVVDKSAASNAFLSRAIRAFNELNRNNIEKTKTDPKNTWTDVDKERALTRFIGRMADITNLGLNATDSELIYMIPFGKELNVMTHYQAIQRAASRKGYRIDISVFPVAKGDSIWFDEEIINGERVSVKKGHQENRDLEITPERLLGDYFSNFWLRMSVYKVNQKGGKDIFIRDITGCLTPREVIQKHAAMSETAFASSWQPTGEKNPDGTLKLNKFGKPECRKVKDFSKFNPDSVWGKCTDIMVWKSVLRSMTWLVKESLPALSPLFEFDDMPQDAPVPESLKKAESPVEAEVVEIIDLGNPPEDVINMANEIKDAYKQNPLLMKSNHGLILNALKTQKAQDVINTFSAEIISLRGTEYDVEKAVKELL